MPTWVVNAFFIRINPWRFGEKQFRIEVIRRLLKPCTFYTLGGVTFNKCWITLSILNRYSPNFQGFILMKNALNNQVGMLGDMFLWLVANLKQGVIYFTKQACGNEIMPSVYGHFLAHKLNIWERLLLFKQVIMALKHGILLVTSFKM